MERYSEYKPTSMQWLKEIPSHWEIKILKRLITYHKSGSWGDEPNYNPHNLTCLRIADYDYDKACFQRKDNYTIRSYKDNEITGRVLHNGDILIEKSGGGEKTPVGRAVYYDLGIPNCMYANFMEKLVVSENIEAKYLVFLLKAAYVNRIVWKYIKYTTGIQNLDLQSMLSNERVPLPPLAEQEKIVSYLEGKTSKIDAYVAEKEKEIQLLQELKQKTIADAVTKGLNPDVKMKDSGISWIGMIPEHWETKRIASMFTGKVNANSDFGYKHAFKFNYGTLVPKNEVGDTEEYRDVYVKYSVIREGDILINGLNLNYDFISQRVAIAPSDGIITSAYVVARPRTGTNAHYYTYLFKTMDSMKLFHGMGTGIRLTLSFDELKKQLVIVPSQDEQRAIVAYIEEKCQKIDTLMTELQAEIDYMKEYKQRLIADCVTGQVNVSGV